MTKYWKTGIGLAGYLVVMVSLVYSQGRSQNVDWPVNGGSPGSTRYSSLKQINQSNVSQLQVAWTYDARTAGGTLETNPIVIDGVLYGYGAGQRVFAANAATGEEIWKFETESAGGRGGNNRGLSYWRGGNDERIFAPVQRYVYALNAKTGKPVPEFGQRGRIDVQADLRGGPEGISAAVGHAPVIYKDLVIFAGRTGEALPAAPGNVRAYDARTGKLRWSFHTLPRPGEYGYDTWPKDAWKFSGNLASWSGMSLDEQRGIVYVPVANPINMFIGRDRPGDNLFSDAVLALNAETGQRIWHFQTVKHDLWDRDVVAPPTLVTVKRDGRTVDAMAQTTKQGFLFLFDRTNGTPLFPIEYRKVPQSNIAGEKASETQPFPVKPAPFAQKIAKMLVRRSMARHCARDLSQIVRKEVVQV